MLKKMEDVKPSQQQEIYFSLLKKHEEALFELGKSEDEVTNELAEFVQFYNFFE